MKAVVLAGGFGTRLKEIVSDVPKPMAPVAGRPFLEYVLDTLVGFADGAVLSVGYKHEVIESHFGHSYKGIPLRYAVEKEPLGTGGAILFALDALDDPFGETLTILNGDTLFRCDLGALSDFHSSHPLGISVALRHTEDSSRFGFAELADSGRITRFVEKGGSASGLINAGIYLVLGDFFDRYGFPSGAFSFEQEALGPMAERGIVWGLPMDGYFIDIGVPHDYARANVELAAG